MSTTHHEPIMGSAPRATPLRRLPVRAEPPEIEDAGGLLTSPNNQLPIGQSLDIEETQVLSITLPPRRTLDGRVGQNRCRDFVNAILTIDHEDLNRPATLRGWRKEHDREICYLYVKDELSIIEITTSILDRCPQLVGVHAAMVENRLIQLDQTEGCEYFAEALKKCDRRAKENEPPNIPVRAYLHCWKGVDANVVPRRNPHGGT